MSYYANALIMRPYIEKAAVSLSDADALNVPTMFPEWAVGITAAEGERLLFKADGKLYRVNKGMGHTTQADWTPDKTPAVFSVVSDGSQAGMIDAPVDASRNMEYEYGKYYRDPEDGLVYLCKSGTETGMIILAYLPHELIGQYFEAA